MSAKVLSRSVKTIDRTTGRTTREELPQGKNRGGIDVSARHNLLVEPLIEATLRDGDRAVLSLPELYAALFADRVQDYPGLRPHHVWAWHMFLVQLAFHATDGRPVPASAAGWREALRALTPAWPTDEPWHLIVPPDAPGFLQPPAPEGVIEVYRHEKQTPDDLDTLIASRNHDIKLQRMARAEPGAWIFALVNIQTMGGFEGRGLYGIMRMNGGYGSRPFMGVRPSGARPGAHLQRDLAVLRRHASTPVVPDAPFHRGGHRLAWLLPWDGEERLPLSELHPLVIEICRRLRLVQRDQTMLCLYKATSTRRIDAEALKGVTGDPWAPVLIARESTHQKDMGQGGKVLTVSVDGFGWRRTRDLLFGYAGTGQVWKRPLLGCVDVEDEAPLDITFAALSRGQGKTNGYHERIVSVPRRIAVETFREGGKAHERAASLSRRLADDADIVLNRCLKAALLFHHQRCPERISFENAASLAAIEPWLWAFDDRLDRAFFPALWHAIEQQADPAQPWKPWRDYLRDTALHVFTLALADGGTATTPQTLFAFRARALLRALLKLHLPESHETTSAIRQANRTLAAPEIERLFSAITKEHLPDRDLGRLRQLDPRSPEPRVFALLERLLGDVGTPSGARFWHRAAAVAQVIALGRDVHNPAISLGAAFEALGLSESRLAEFVLADADALMTLAPRITRRLALTKYPANIRQLASLLWHTGQDEDRADAERSRIISGYFFSLHKKKQKTSPAISVIY